MFRTANLTVDFTKILSQDTADKLHAMTPSEIAIITRRITNNRMKLDSCNKHQILNTLRYWLKYKEPAKSTEIDRYIITRQDESKFVAGKVYNGDISKDNYTIISRTAKTVIIIRNNNEYANNPRKCSILRQNKTEYIIYAGEFIYSFNENANVNPVLLEEKKTEAKIKFEIGQTYISTSGYYDENYRCERYGYYTVIARTDKTVTFVEAESLKPENIIIDANTGKRIYNSDFYKPTRRNINIDNNGVEEARLDVLFSFSANKYVIADDKKDSFIEGYGEIITVEAKEFQEPAELTINAEFSEVKAIAAKTENNTVTPVPVDIYPLNFSEAVEELKNAYAPERTPYKGTPHYCQSPQTTVLNILCDCSNNTLFQIIELENLRYYWNDHKDNTTYFNENSPRDEIIRGIAEQLLQRMNYLVNKGSYFYDNLDAFAISRKTEILSAWINTYKRIYRHVLKDSPMPQNDERETPEFEDEFYSDFAGDNSHPEQDIPEDHEPDGANVNGTNLNLEEYRKEIAKLWQICNRATLPETAQPEAKPVIPAQPVTPAKSKTRKQDTDARVFQEIIRDLDALTPEEIISDQDKLNILCEDLCAVLSGMKKAQILEFAAQRNISLLSLQHFKKKTNKDIAGYICKKLAMFKTIEAQQAITPKINKPVEPQISHVAHTSQPSKGNHTPTCIFGGQVILILEGDNYLFDFESEAA